MAATAYHVGDKIVLIKKHQEAIIRYIGKTTFAPNHVSYGLELLDNGVGDTNGTVDGHTYFACAPNKGLFAQEKDIKFKIRIHHRKKSSVIKTAFRKDSSSSLINVHDIFAEKPRQLTLTERNSRNSANSLHLNRRKSEKKLGLREMGRNDSYHGIEDEELQALAIISDKRRSKSQRPSLNAQRSSLKHKRESSSSRKLGLRSSRSVGPSDTVSKETYDKLEQELKALKLSMANYAHAQGAQIDKERQKDDEIQRLNAELTQTQTQLQSVQTALAEKENLLQTETQNIASMEQPKTATVEHLKSESHQLRDNNEFMEDIWSNPNTDDEAEAEDDDDDGDNNAFADVQRMKLSLQSREAELSDMQMEMKVQTQNIAHKNDEMQRLYRELETHKTENVRLRQSERDKQDELHRQETETKTLQTSLHEKQMDSLVYFKFMQQMKEMQAVINAKDEQIAELTRTQERHDGAKLQMVIVGDEQVEKAVPGNDDELNFETDNVSTSFRNGYHGNSSSSSSDESVVYHDSHVRYYTDDEALSSNMTVNMDSNHGKPGLAVHEDVVVDDTTSSGAIHGVTGEEHKQQYIEKPETEVQQEEKTTVDAAETDHDNDDHNSDEDNVSCGEHVQPAPEPIDDAALVDEIDDNAEVQPLKQDPDETHVTSRSVDEHEKGNADEHAGTNEKEKPLSEEEMDALRMKSIYKRVSSKKLPKLNNNNTFDMMKQQQSMDMLYGKRDSHISTTHDEVHEQHEAEALKSNNETDADNANADIATNPPPSNVQQKGCCVVL